MRCLRCAARCLGHHRPSRTTTPRGRLAGAMDQAPARSPHGAAPQVLHESQAGILHPEECIRAHIDLARRRGAEVLEHAQVEPREALQAG